MQIKIPVLPGILPRYESEKETPRPVLGEWRPVHRIRKPGLDTEPSTPPPDHRDPVGTRMTGCFFPAISIPFNSVFNSSCLARLFAFLPLSWTEPRVT